MSGLVQLGNVPEWIQGAAEAGALYLAVRGRRQQQALDWAATLKELSGLSDEELRHVVGDNPVVAEIVGRAWEAAAETASQDKRRLLAKVAAAAIRGDADAQVDELPFLLRTVTELDPAHITLLVRVDEHEYAANAQDLVDASWPTHPELLEPALSTLERAGLIHQPSYIKGEPRESWFLTNYGRRFLTFLQETGETEPTS
jgi:hypothetical protein